MRYANMQTRSPRLTKPLLALMLLVVMGGCETWRTQIGLPPTENRIAPECARFGPVCLSGSDKISEGTLYQIVRNNEAGKAMGCWPNCKGN